VQAQFSHLRVWTNVRELASHGPVTARKETVACPDCGRLHLTTGALAYEGTTGKAIFLDDGTVVVKQASASRR